MTGGGPNARRVDSPWVVDVAELITRHGNRKPVSLVGVIADVANASATLDGPVTFDATLEAIPEGVTANGAASAAWTAVCSRCLEPATGAVEAALTELFSPDPEPGETFPLTGARVDFEPPLREALLLELPSVPLCRPQCAGLCSECGADRNEGDCGCTPDNRDPRWAALSELRFAEEDEPTDR